MLYGYISAVAPCVYGCEVEREGYFISRSSLAAPKFLVRSRHHEVPWLEQELSRYFALSAFQLASADCSIESTRDVVGGKGWIGDRQRDMNGDLMNKSRSFEWALVISSYHNVASSSIAASDTRSSSSRVRSTAQINGRFSSQAGTSDKAEGSCDWPSFKTAHLQDSSSASGSFHKQIFHTR